MQSHSSNSTLSQNNLFTVKKDSTPKRRADFDRNLLKEFNHYFSSEVKKIDLSHLMVLDLGAGLGELYHVLNNMPDDKKPAVVVQFELDRYVSEINPTVAKEDKGQVFDKAIAKNGCILRINPQEYFIDLYEAGHKNTGNFQFYNYIKLLQDLEKQGINKFMIIGNPPYYLWNRILSLNSLPQCEGFLGITSMRRVYNHTGGRVTQILNLDAFDPPPTGIQTLIWSGKIVEKLPKTEDFFYYDNENNRYAVGNVPATAEFPTYPLAWITSADTSYWKALRLDGYEQFHGDKDIEIFLSYVVLDHHDKSCAQENSIYQAPKAAIKKMLDDLDQVELIKKLEAAHVKQSVIEEYCQQGNALSYQKNTP